MDNVFEILIYLLIIVSFLSSLFKKKKKPQQQPGSKMQQMQSLEQEQKTFQSKADDEREPQPDFLKEIEDFFKVGSEEKPKFVQPRIIAETKDELETETMFEPPSYARTEKVDSSVPDPWEKKKVEVKEQLAKVDSTIEKQATEFEKRLKRRKSEASEISKKIRKRLQSPGTLKDYIIISELMGKPKSLRR